MTPVDDLLKNSVSETEGWFHRDYACLSSSLWKVAPVRSAWLQNSFARPASLVVSWLYTFSTSLLTIHESQPDFHNDDHFVFFSFQSERKMTSETPPTISMALVNPQMSSASADSKNSSTQQLSISVWVTVLSSILMLRCCQIPDKRKDKITNQEIYKTPRKCEFRTGRAEYIEIT